MFETVFYYSKIILYAMLGLGILVFVHELGHLICARLSRIKVEKFSIGWGPAIFKWQIGETTYQVSWFLIIGGYCKMKGQDDFAKEDPIATKDSFYGRPAWSRLVAVLGGPLFSYLFAVLLFFLVFAIYGQHSLKYSRVAVNPAMSGISELQSGDTITQIGTTPIRSWSELKEATFEYTNKTVDVKVLREYLVVNNIRIDSFENLFSAMSSVSKKRDVLINRSSVPFTVKHKFILPTQNVVPDHTVYTEEHPEVASTMQGSAYPASGLLFAGDVIKSISGFPVYNQPEITNYVNQLKKQNSATIPIFEIFRKGKEKFAIEEIIQPNDNSNNSFGKITQSDVDKYFVKIDNKYYKFKPEYNESNLRGKLKILYRQTLKGNLSIPINPIKQNDRYMIGIQIQENASHLERYREHTSIGFFRAISMGFTQTNYAIVLNVVGIIKLIRGDVPVKGSVGGPVKIFEMLGKMGAVHGFGSFLSFVAMISALLAFANMLPIPAVDGSHVILSIIEMIRRKNFSATFIRRFQTIGLFIIISLFLIVTYFDIFSLFDR